VPDDETTSHLDADAVQRYIENRDWEGLKERLADWAPAELSDLLVRLRKDQRVLVFRILAREKSADAFAHLDGESQKELLEALSEEETRRILTEIRPDDRTSVLSEMPAEVTRRLLRLMTAEDFREAQLLLGYPEESVGRLMTPEYVAVPADRTAAQALDHIRTHGQDSETVNVVYVTDEGWHLIGAVRLRQLILTPTDAKVADLMTKQIASLSAFDDREEAVRVMKKYDVPVLPVVDSEGSLVGIVTVDDVMDVAEAEATEDFQKTAAVAPLGGSYREATVRTLYRRRVGWLGALVLVNLVSSSVILVYEDTLASVIALAFFIPLLMGTGGNTGAQAATLMVRAIAVGELDVQNWLKALGKELAVGAALGLSLGIIGSLVGAYQGGWVLAAIVGVSMVSIVLVANIIGFLMPVFMDRAKMDPAAASSPLVTSLMDIVGLLIYFGVATWFITQYAATF
jgi:magnesium transporter